MAAMRRALVGVVAVVSVVCAFVAANGRSATGEGLIVFPGTPEGATITQLFAVSPGGGEVKQLTRSGTQAYDPVFSPAGTRIAFVRLGYGIYTMNADGSGLRRLSRGGRDTNPTWSPDGKRIAFLRPKGSAWKLWVVPATGGKPARIKLAPAAGRPSWTKAGLFVPTSADVIKVNPATGRILTYLDAQIDSVWGLNSVAVAPTAAWMTYIGTRDPIPGDMECGDGPCQRYGLYLEDLRAKKKVGKLIVKDAGAAAFSPDGKRIAYVTGGQLFVRGVASKASSAIATPGVTPVLTGAPAWR